MLISVWGNLKASSPTPTYANTSSLSVILTASEFISSFIILHIFFRDSSFIDLKYGSVLLAISKANFDCIAATSSFSFFIASTIDIKRPILICPTIIGI